MDEGENLKGLLTHTKKSGVLWVVIIGVIAGVVLLLIGNHSSDGSGSKSDGTVSTGDVDEYKTQLEAQITKLVSEVDGAGSVSVCVTLDGGFEYVYAQNVTDKSGYESREYIVIGSGSSESAVFLRMKAPEISGIGVVCSGGGDPAVKSEIIRLVSASCGVGTNKIYVAAKSP